MAVNYPDYLPSGNLSTNQKRRALSDAGKQLPPGLTYKELPIAMVDRALWEPDLLMVGRKIMLGLFDQTFGRPLPREGCMAIYVTTNVHNFDSDWVKICHNLTDNFVAPERTKKSLGDQFLIRYGYQEMPRTAVYMISLQKTIQMVGLVCETSIFTNDDGHVFSPFEWTSCA